LHQLVSILGDLTNLADASFDAAAKVAFAGFLRCGEFTVGSSSAFDPAINLARSAVEFVPSIDHPTHVCLTLPASKTDPFRSGVTVFISRTPDALASVCAVRSLQHLFMNFPASSSSPLFSGSSDGLALTRTQFISTLKLRLTSLGYPASNYSGHSFRRGAATSASAAGLSPDEIQSLGRWRSDCYKIYIDTPTDKLIKLSSRIHLALLASPSDPVPLELL